MWLFKFSTESAASQLQKMIDEQKFYKTLDTKIDNAIDDYIEEIPVVENITPIFSEELKGETLLGGAMKLTADWKINKDK